MIKYKDLNIEYIESFLSKGYSDTVLLKLLNEVIWQNDTINMFGKAHLLPRLTAFYGDAGKVYNYSGISMEPLPWTKLLIDIKKIVEEKVKISFNTVFLNRYRNGEDYQGFHSDNESSLGENINIASISFGAERDFKMKHKTNSNSNSFSINLKHGSLLIMRHPTQNFWLHSIPKRLKIKEERINLTFRKIMI